MLRVMPLLEYSVYAKTYNLMPKQKWCARTYDCRTRVCITHIYAIMLYTSVYLSVYRALPRTESIFLIFQGSFLKAAQAVLFHTTAVDCNHGRNIEDPSFFILERVLQVCPKFKVPFSQRRSRSGRASWTVTKEVLKTEFVARTN